MAKTSGESKRPAKKSSIYLTFIEYNCQGLFFIRVDKSDSSVKACFFKKKLGIVVALFIIVRLLK